MLSDVELHSCNILKHIFLQLKNRGRWLHWNELIKSSNLEDKRTKIQDLIIPTMDTIRYTFLMDLSITYAK